MYQSKDKEFQKRLLATFKNEADEHICAISAGLLQLEKTTEQDQASGIIETIYREAHSLKGASRAVNLDQIEAVCRAMENVFTLVKKGQVKLDSIEYDILHKSLDFSKSIMNVSQEGNEDETAESSALMEILKEIESITSPELKSADPLPPKPPENEEVVSRDTMSIQKVHPAKDTVRIAVSKLDSILHQSEELISVKLKLNQHTSDLNNFKTKLENIKRQFSRQMLLLNKSNGSENIRRGVESNAVEETISVRFNKFLHENQNQINSFENSLTDNILKFEQERKSASSLFNSLLDEIRDLLLLPFHSILELFPKLVRDLIRDQGKEAILRISGSELEIDRRILEMIKDPLIHIVRNCVDHGIEKPEERARKQKSEAGTIDISISQLSSNMVEISISDDGRGIDLKEVGQKAKKLGLISGETLKNMSDKDILELIFQSDFTTSKMITDISGRGLGMTIVREKVELIGGNISVDTQKDEGTTIRLILPHSFGTFRGITVNAGAQEFVIPTRNVENVTNIRGDQVKTIENKEVINYNGDALSFIQIDELLGLEQGTNVSGKANQHVLILKAGNKRIAASVSDILMEQEILIKPLSEPIKRIRYFEGVTLLGSGKVVLIVNVQDIIRSVEQGLTGQGRKKDPGELKQKQASVLVAEDSMTARMLLKDILESYGYLVKTALDGAEALSLLREDSFDVLVSDVEMPRMDGFELTSKIRKDKNLNELPVILVTALKSREDRERGMEVGANAYIEKGKFEPQSLLKTIEKLI